MRRVEAFSCTAVCACTSTSWPATTRSLDVPQNSARTAEWSIPAAAVRNPLRMKTLNTGRRDPGASRHLRIRVDRAVRGGNQIVDSLRRCTSCTLCTQIAAGFRVEPRDARGSKLRLTDDVFRRAERLARARAKLGMRRSPRYGKWSRCSRRSFD